MNPDRWIALVLCFLIGCVLGYFCKFTWPRRCPGCGNWTPAYGYLYLIWHPRHHFWHPRCWNKTLCDQHKMFPAQEHWTTYELWLMRTMDRWFPNAKD